MGGVTYVMSSRQLQHFRGQTKTTYIILTLFWAKPPSLIPVNIAGWYGISVRGSYYNMWAQYSDK